MPFHQEQFAHVRGHALEKEVTFLLAAAESGSRYVDFAALNAELGPLDPVRLFELARLNKMITFLPSRKTLLPQGCAVLAGEIDKVRLRAMALNRRGLMEGIRISRMLEEAGIAHLHIKGPLQQLALYGSYYQKPSADIDILVLPQQRRLATERIKRAGYVQLDSHIAIWWQVFLREIHLRHPDTGGLVDLHHDLQQPGLPRPRNLDEFFRQRSVMTFENMDFQVPGPSHRVLLSAISLSKAFLSREPALSSLFDLRAALSRLGPTETAQLDAMAQSVRLEQTLGFALRMLDAVFPASAPTQPPIARPMAGLASQDLRRMLITPWLDGLPWPRRRKLMAELCGPDSLRYTRESLRSVMSEAFRKALEHRSIRKGEEAR